MSAYLYISAYHFQARKLDEELWVIKVIYFMTTMLSHGRYLNTHTNIH